MISFQTLGTCVAGAAIVATFSAAAQTYQWPGELLVHEPAGVVQGAVVVLHGRGRSPETVFDEDTPLGQWRPIGDREGLVIIAPGTVAEEDWEDCRERAASNRPGAPNHVSDLRALIASIAERHRLGRDRIFLSGVSNGGGMVLRAARAFPHEIAGVASVLGSDPQESADRCQDDGGIVPVVLINGLRDDVVPYNGDARQAGAPATFANWRRRNGVASEPVGAFALPARASLPSPGVTCEFARRVDTPRGSTMLCTVEDGGHLEPSIAAPYDAASRALLGPQNRRVETAELMWAFFESALPPAREPEPEPEPQPEAEQPAPGAAPEPASPGPPAPPPQPDPAPDSGSSPSRETPPPSASEGQGGASGGAAGGLAGAYVVLLLGLLGWSRGSVRPAPFRKRLAAVGR